MIRLTDETYTLAQESARLYQRSIPKQIEYWVQLGRAIEANPDLPPDFIKSIFQGLEDIKRGNVVKYEGKKLW